MPFLSITTNLEMERPAQQQAVAKLSQACAELLGKPESYMMVAMQSGVTMSFAGNADPCAIVTLASLGLPESKTADYSAALCELIGELLALPSERIYLHFTNPDRHMWGWNRSTF
jgi:phenylpyruvate tautomerase PptA (4-oxalocrotonate tautomerase family)